MGAINDAHPTGADFFENEVAADRLAIVYGPGSGGHLVPCSEPSQSPHIRLRTKR